MKGATLNSHIFTFTHTAKDGQKEAYLTLGFHYNDYCISCYFREGFIFANFASQTLAKISTSIHIYL